MLLESDRRIPYMADFVHLSSVLISHNPFRNYCLSSQLTDSVMCKRMPMIPNSINCVIYNSPVRGVIRPKGLFGFSYLGHIVVARQWTEYGNGS